jgi:hypothetical protein
MIIYYELRFISRRLFSVAVDIAAIIVNLVVLLGVPRSEWNSLNVIAVYAFTLFFLMDVGSVVRKVNYALELLRYAYLPSSGRKAFRDRLKKIRRTLL